MTEHLYLGLDGDEPQASYDAETPREKTCAQVKGDDRSSLTWPDDRVWAVEYFDGRFHVVEMTANGLLDEMLDGVSVFAAHRLNAHGRLVEWDFSAALQELREDLWSEDRDRAALRDARR